MTIMLMPRFLGLLPPAALSPASWYNLGLLVLVLLLVVSSYWAYRAWSDIHEEEAAGDGRRADGGIRGGPGRGRARRGGIRPRPGANPGVGIGPPPHGSRQAGEMTCRGTAARNRRCR